MIRLLLLGLLLLTTLSSDDNTTTFVNDINQTTEVDNSTITISSKKVLYVKCENIPERLIKGEIFHITIKTLSIVENSTDITYELSNQVGLKLLTEIPDREIDSKYFYDTFYFLVTSKNAKLPDFNVILHTQNINTRYKNFMLVGEKLNIVTLNPKKNFSNIIANSFELLEYKTTTFDDEHNIIVFIATATNSDITAFKLQDIYKQGFESTIESHFDSKLIYFAVINKKIENFSFSYFNLLKNKFVIIDIPIIVLDDSVTTQSDLKPKDQSKEMIKMSVAAIIALVASIFILWRKKYIYLIFIIIPLAYIAYIVVPSKEVCIKIGANIYLLPMSNGTIFEKTKTKLLLQKEGSVKKFIKVKLDNNKIGWVKNEDICSH